MDSNISFVVCGAIDNGKSTLIGHLLKLLNGIDIKLNCDFFINELPNYDKVIYTGPIDKFFNYKYLRKSQEIYI